MTFQEDPKNPFEENYFDSISERISNKLDRRSEINHYEIYCSIVRSKSVGFEQGAIKKAQQKSSRGIGLRVIGNQGREGMTFTSDFSDLALEIIENQSIKMMKAATPNPFFKDLAHPSPNYTKISNIYDPTIQKLSIEQINEYLKPLMELKERPHHPRSLSGSFSTALGATHIQNSNGISKWDKFSTASCSVEISLVENQVPSGGFDWQSVCQLKDLDVNHVAEYSYKVATRGLRRKSVQSGHYPILLSPLAVSQFLLQPLISGINAERVQNNISFLGEKQHQQIGVESLNLQDDPHIPGHLGTESFDAEGVATKPLSIIKDGILEDFYHNSFTAGKINQESNGHASRGSYSGNIGISNNNVIMEPGNESYNDILAGIKRGIYFEYTGDSPNLITGDFSGLIMTGYLIEDGKIGPALEETMIATNLLKSYKSIQAISKERKWIDEFYVPYVLLEDATISGRN